ncbi:MAG: enoyl-CoA hydratase/isomerase family protein [Deltaproteobacteria bacterium]|nr:enoyl-CoA hydratase/isomerase family protein [Deltaproteobacteria bacterium]
MGYECLNLERDEQVAVMTLDRSEKLNALNAVLRKDILNAVAEVREDDDIRTLVITGTGRGFCSGADLSGSRPEPTETIPQNQRLDEMSWMGQQALAIGRLDKPVIAAVNGVAAGAGMSLALACDLRVGSEKTSFKTVFPERSLSPDTGMTFFLPRIIGYSRAIDLIFTSRRVEAEEAYRLGLLDRLVEHDKLMEEAVGLAKQIAFWPPMAIRSSKRTLQRNMEVDLEQALRNETMGLSYARSAPNDMKESRLSWLEKRPPKFTGQ